jgi:Tfp pilus assembly protein FimT
MVEVLLVLAVIAILAGMAFPMLGNMLGFFRLHGDARSMTSAVSLARMQAASNFSRTRVYFDFATRSYHTEIKTPTTNWTARGNTQYLSTSIESYSYSPVSTAPSNTQGAIGQASACLDNAGQAIANTACVVFNSRGIPIDSTGAPTGANAIYITDGTVVYGITVSATSIIRTWRTTATSTANWVRQ